MVSSKIPEDRSAGGLRIDPADVGQEFVRRELIDYLAPHETHALFLLGNLLNHTCASELYVARHNGRMIGVCGYYPAFQSCSIFSEDAEATEAFARIMMHTHPSVKTVLGMADIVKPAYEVFVASGRHSTRDPEVLFLELETATCVPCTSPDGVVRRMTEKDVEQVTKLQRRIHGIPMESSLTEQERARVVANPMTMCFDIDQKIVSVAASNGRAITAFQILGVVTDPAYRRRGYAKCVCSSLICSMREQGGTRAIIFTGKDNVAALHCYRSLGFQVTDRYYAPWFE